jgi:DNA-nicking Smr family endonuclease
MKDDEFESLMKGSGVRRLGDTRGGRRLSQRLKKIEPPRPDQKGTTAEVLPAPLVFSDDPEEEFVSAMQAMESVVQKDLLAAPSSPHQSASYKKPYRRAVHVTESLDLHGCTADDALSRISAFVNNAWRQGHLRVLVVTGKGHNSTHGPVIRPTVKTWIQTEGATYIESYSEAAREQGGSGALILEIRSRKASKP